MDRVITYLRHDLPLWLISILTSWWPDVGPAVRLRGWLCSWCVGKSGRNLAIGRDVTILRPERLVLGESVYLAKGVWINAIGTVEIEDEVMLSPYVVLASNRHRLLEGSVAWGGGDPAPIRIGRGSWLASHAVVVAGVTVGRGVIVGANAVVTRDTPDNVLVGGVPATVLRQTASNHSEADTSGRKPMK